jgi:hypothetical protein
MYVSLNEVDKYTCVEKSILKCCDVLGWVALRMNQLKNYVDRSPRTCFASVCLYSTVQYDLLSLSIEYPVYENQESKYGIKNGVFKNRIVKCQMPVLNKFCMCQMTSFDYCLAYRQIYGLIVTVKYLLCTHSLPRLVSNRLMFPHPKYNA